MLLVESSKAFPDPGQDLGRRYDLCPSCISLILDQDMGGR